MPWPPPAAGPASRRAPPSVAADLRAEWRDGEVLVLTIDRPERRNVLDHDLLQTLAEHLREEGSEAAAVVLRGAGGRAFSAGFDLGLLEGTQRDLEADASIGGAVQALAACPAPVVAEIGGHCHGGGVELALSCDLRIASGDLSLSLGAVSLSVVYRYEFLVRLVATCGLGRAQDLLLGQRRLGANEALAWGLVTEVVSPEELEQRALEVARAAASLPRIAVAGTKASLLRAAQGALREEALRVTLEWRREAARSDERREALAAARARLKGRSSPAAAQKKEEA